MGFPNDDEAALGGAAWANPSTPRNTDGPRIGTRAVRGSQEGSVWANPLTNFKSTRETALSIDAFRPQLTEKNMKYWGKKHTNLGMTFPVNGIND